jgi:cation diffusion facilitator family transporter
MAVDATNASRQHTASFAALASEAAAAPVGDAVVAVAPGPQESGTAASGPAESARLENGVADHSWRLRIEEFERLRVDEAQRQRCSARVARFYAKQNERIDQYTQADAIVCGRGAGMDSEEGREPLLGTAAGDDQPGRLVRLAIDLSFYCNVALLAVKVVAAVLSGSLAVIASVVDSALDLLSGSIIFVAAHMARAKDPRGLYPVGKARLEPLSIIIFATVMGMAALQLLREGAQALVAGLAGAPPTIEVDATVWAILGTVVTVKFALMLFCLRVAPYSASVEALYMDHRNDVATNSATIVVLLIVTSYQAAWWLDSVTAIVLALAIMATWLRVGREHATQMAGRVASPEILSQLTFLAFNHDQRIQYIDTVRAYHIGTKIVAELDIVLSPDMPLREAHDIGESLQRRIEELGDVERAFVHLDYEFQHRAHDEHAYPSRLRPASSFKSIPQAPPPQQQHTSHLEQGAASTATL